MKTVNRKALLYASVIAKLFLLATIGYSTAAFINASNSVYLSERLIEVSHRIVVTLLDAESGQRGYVITGDTEYLDPYNFAVTNIDSELNNLNLTSQAGGNQYPQVDNIINLTHAKMNELYKTIKLRKTQSFEAARDLVMKGDGIKLMGKLQGSLNQVISQEDISVFYYDKIITWTGFIIVGGLMIFSVLAVISVWITKSAFNLVTYPVSLDHTRDAPTDPHHNP
jgi:CHASE3 domain sensor protein